MSVARAGTLGATRICPHCKAVVLQAPISVRGASTICASVRQCGTASGAEVGDAHRRKIRHSCATRAANYVVVISINQRARREIARQVGASRAAARREAQINFSVDLMPVRSAAERKRN